MPERRRRLASESRGAGSLRSATVALVALCVLVPRLTDAVAPADQPGPEPSAALGDELAESQALIEAGSYEQAVVRLRAVAARHPNDAEVRLLLGTALALVPRRSEALEELTRAVDLRPDFAPAHNALGMALSRFVEPVPARRAFERAIALDPDFAQAHVNLALVLIQTDEADVAIRHLGNAITILGDDPAAAYPHHLRGILHTERGQFEEALRELERAVALQPDSIDSYLHLGLTRRQVLDFDGARAAFQQAVERSPDRAEAHYELGREYARASRHDAAIEHLRRAASAKPEDTAILYSLARALQSGGQSREARAVQAKILEIRRTTEQAQQDIFAASRLNNEGVELEQAGELDAAIVKYTAALELDPLHTVFRRNLALALCRAGRWEEGIEELEEVLRLEPDDRDASKALYVALEMVERDN